MKKYVTAEYDIHIRRKELPSGILRIVFLSDMHNSCSEEETAELLGRIRRADPDLVLCGGDMIVSRNVQSVEEAAAFMRRLSGMYPVWMGTGNHEYRTRIYPETYGSMYEEYRNLLADSDVVFLEDAYADVSAGLRQESVAEEGSSLTVPVRIFGFDLKAEFYSRIRRRALSCADMREQIGRPDPDRLNLLLAHNPRYMNTYLSWGADLTLSGHFHGGILRLGRHRGLAAPDLVPFSSHCYGQYEKDGRYGIVTAGCGEHTLPVRIFNPREIVSVRIHINR